jgi:hypothetical protein
VQHKSVMYRRIDGFSGNLRCFSILYSILRGGFRMHVKYVLCSVLVAVVKLLCMLYRVHYRDVTNICYLVAVVPIMWICLY